MVQLPSLKRLNLHCLPKDEDDMGTQTHMFCRILTSYQLQWKAIDGAISPSLPMQDIGFIRVGHIKQELLNQLKNLRRIQFDDHLTETPLLGGYFLLGGDTANIHLEELSMSSLNMEGLNCLRSMQARGRLRGLEVSLPGFYETIAHAELFRVAIPTLGYHGLEELHIRCCYTGSDGWERMYGVDFVLGSCKNLRVLPITPGRRNRIHSKRLLNWLYEGEDVLPKLEVLNLRECTSSPTFGSSKFLSPRKYYNCQFQNSTRLLQILPPVGGYGCKECVNGWKAARLEITNAVQSYFSKTRGEIKDGLTVTVPKEDSNSDVRVWKWNFNERQAIWKFRESGNICFDIE